MCCDIKKLSMYDFMSKMGMLYLHPGMLTATKKLVELCQINKKSKILDVGCGNGTTAIYLAKEGYENIEGIDISDDMISTANEKIKNKNLSDKIKFQKGDATAIPFNNDLFDAVICEAVLLLVEDKRKVLSECIRVIRKRGIVGVIEPMWVNTPSRELVKEFHDFCKCDSNILTFEEWGKMFNESGLVKKELLMFKGMGMENCFHDISMMTIFRMTFKFMTDSVARKRIQNMMTFFRRRKEEVGYLIYVGQKQ